MQKQENKTIYLNEYVGERKPRKRVKQDQRYQCVMADDRLTGHCEILIYDYYQRSAELFSLYFLPGEQTGYQYFREEEALLWLQSNTVQHISYRQAILLLGDAARRMYKQQITECQWPELYDSIHVQRTWMREYYNAESNGLEWLLKEIDAMQFIQTYLTAINNKDAVLLYDMMAESRQKITTRELYAYNWNHALEEITLLDFAVMDVKRLPVQHRWIFYLLVCGESSDQGTLSIDLCLHLTYENGCMKLQEEQVLEASAVSSCCTEM